MHTALVSHETSSGPSNNVIGVPGEEKLWGMMGIFMGFVHISEFTNYILKYILFYTSKVI